MDGLSTIDDSFPNIRSAQPAYQGSQSSVPMPQADPRKDVDSYRANTDKITGKNRMKDYPYPGDK
jgi:hypothetical protein